MEISAKNKLSLTQILHEGESDIFSYLPKSRHLSFSSGRGGIEYICNSLIGKGETILLPCFVAEGVVKPIEILNIKTKYYKLNKDLSVNLENLGRQLRSDKTIRMVIIIHYFGYSQPIRRINELCKENKVILFEDCAQALFSRDHRGQYLGTKSDISLFSLPKSLPLIDGALIFFNNDKLYPSKVEYRKSLSQLLCLLSHLIFMLLNNYNSYFNSKVMNKIFRIISSKLYWNGYYYFLMHMPKPSKISKISKRLLTNFDYDEYILKKSKVAMIIDNTIDKLKYVPLKNKYDKNNILLGMAFMSKNRDFIAKFLKENLGIEPFIFNQNKNFSGRWDYIADEHEFLNESNFIKTHFIIPVVPLTNPESLETKIIKLNYN